MVSNGKFARVALIMVALIIVCTPSFAFAVEEDLNDEVLSEIIGRARDFEKAFLGNFSRRRATARVLHGKTGELKSRRDFVVDVWDYHGESPINEVRNCRIDDEPVNASDCAEKRRLKPTFRLFNDDPIGDTDKYYRYEYQGVATWKGQRSHRVRVIPLENTTRHLKGEVFFLVDSLRFVGMHITLADYPFGLKDLSIDLSFEDQDGLPVIASGESRVHIYVPFLINERTETVFTASEQRLLKERHIAHTASTGG